MIRDPLDPGLSKRNSLDATSHLDSFSNGMNFRDTDFADLLPL